MSKANSGEYDPEYSHTVLGAVEPGDINDIQYYGQGDPEGDAGKLMNHPSVNNRYKLFKDRRKG